MAVFGALMTTHITERYRLCDPALSGKPIGGSPFKNPPCPAASAFGTRRPTWAVPLAVAIGIIGLGAAAAVATRKR